MKTIYIINADKYGEAQGAFLETQGSVEVEYTLLGFWSLNDANFREEYFDEFLTKLGIELATPTDKQEKKMVKMLEAACKAEWY